MAKLKLISFLVLTFILALADTSTDPSPSGYDYSDSVQEKPLNDFSNYNYVNDGSNGVVSKRLRALYYYYSYYSYSYYYYSGYYYYSYYYYYSDYYYYYSYYGASVSLAWSVVVFAIVLPIIICVAIVVTIICCASGRCNCCKRSRRPPPPRF